MNESTINCITVALVWSAYLALHSAMISITVTEFLKRARGDRYREYQNRVSMFVPWKWLKLKFIR